MHRLVPAEDLNENTKPQIPLGKEGERFTHGSSNERTFVEEQFWKRSHGGNPPAASAFAENVKAEFSRRIGELNPNAEDTRCRVKSFRHD